MATATAKTYKKGPIVSDNSPSSACEVFIVSLWEGHDGGSCSSTLTDMLSDAESEGYLNGYEVHRAV